MPQREPTEQQPSAAWRWWLLGALAALLLSWWSPGVRQLFATHMQPESAQALPAAPALNRPLPRAAAANPPEPPRCAPQASKACYVGDVWWFDGCGDLQTRAQSCDGRGCSEGRCTAAPASDEACGSFDEYGRCDGEVATACLLGQLLRVDCAQHKARCIMTSEGAQCLPLDDKLACAPAEPAVCKGSVLRLCVDGRYADIDCTVRKAVCRSGADGARCVASTPLPSAKTAVEICDGHDNDEDQRVDEGGVCDSVPLVAFVPADAKLENLQARMHNELAILNRVLAPLQFRWGKTVEVPASYRTFDPKDLEATSLQLSQLQSNLFLGHVRAATPTAPPAALEGFDFYVAVLYTEQLLLEPPKSGISTLPNAHCGGMRISDRPSPPHGLIVLSEARRPETLAHEMGHYLGLCHTHETLERFARYDNQSVACTNTGDGICDTPLDPGTTQCTHDPACNALCPSVAARPDATNVMSYYMGCRRELTSEQLALTQRGMSLRRGWFACLDPRDCVCDPMAAHACPAEMSCHPGEQRDSPWLCELDGAALPGTGCSDSSQCSQGAFCLWQSRGPSAAASCTRPCGAAGAGDSCICTDVGLPFRVCAEDLRR